MKLKTNRRVVSECSQSQTRRDGQLFLNICKGVSCIGLLVLQYLKQFYGL